LDSNEYLGDVIARKVRENRNFKLVFKRKVFIETGRLRSSANSMKARAAAMPWSSGVYLRLAYLQAEDEVIRMGNLQLSSREEVIKLAALAFELRTRHVVSNRSRKATKAGNEDSYWDEERRATVGAPFLSADRLVEDGIIDSVAKGWRDRSTPEEWGQAVQPLLADIIPKKTEKLYADFIEAVCGHDLYGAMFFNVLVVSWDGLLSAFYSAGSGLHVYKVAINEKGLRILTTGSDVLVHVGFQNIIDWGVAGPSTFMVRIRNPKDKMGFDLKLSTDQAAGLSNGLSEYYSAIEDSTKTDVFVVELKHAPREHV